MDPCANAKEQEPSSPTAPMYGVRMNVKCTHMHLFLSAFLPPSRLRSLQARITSKDEAQDDG